MAKRSAISTTPQLVPPDGLPSTDPFDKGQRSIDQIADLRTTIMDLRLANLKSAELSSAPKSSYARRLRSARERRRRLRANSVPSLERKLQGGGRPDYKPGLRHIQETASVRDYSAALRCTLPRESSQWRELRRDELGHSRVGRTGGALSAGDWFESASPLSEVPVCSFSAMLFVDLSRLLMDRL